LSGFNVEPHQWATVLVVGNTSAPPTVVVEAWSDASSMSCGSVEVAFVVPPAFVAADAVAVNVQTTRARSPTSEENRLLGIRFSFSG
jgi:hypothetical protein